MNIYEKHDQVFKNITAAVITDHKCARVATIAFKYGSTGFVQCFFHLIGIEMTRGTAGGGGYDKKSAAFYDAVNRAKILDGANPEMVPLLARIKTAADAGNGGSSWDNALRAEGFNVLFAI